LLQFRPFDLLCDITNNFHRKSNMSLDNFSCMLHGKVIKKDDLLRELHLREKSALCFTKPAIVRLIRNGVFSKF
jgi:hypothetical protein